MNPEPPAQRSGERPRANSIGRRLRDWLTPPQPEVGLGAPRPLLAGVALDVFHIDGSTRQLLDPGCCHYAYQVLRERGFDNRLIQLRDADLQCWPDHALLAPGALATARWLT
ncbi:MAG: hypothetical protein KDI51_19620 [Xanthomonadales bacterium]|nr:hypothetical protein [Xanthomonadales bacterium]